MLLYTTIGTSDIARATAFRGPILQSLGHVRIEGLDDGRAGWGKDHDGGFGLYLCPPLEGQAAHAGNGGTFAFAARDAAQVCGLHALALTCGGTDDGAPELRDDYTADFYVAYVRAPDGHKLALVFHHHDPAKNPA